MRVWIPLWIVYIVWGSTYLGIRYMVETIPPVLGSGLRFFVAGALMAVWLVLRRGGVRALGVSRRELACCAFVGVALLLGGNGLVSVGEDNGVPSGLAALIFATIPLWVVLFRRLSGETVSRTTLVCLVVGFAGVALLLLPGERPDGATLGGLLTILAGAFCWSAGTFGSSRLSMPPDLAVSTALQMLLGGFAMIVVGLVAGEAGSFPLGSVSTESALGFAYLVVFGSLVAFTAYAWLLQHAPVSQVATYAYVNPVVAIALGAVFVDEEITALVVVAAAVIVASVAGTVRVESARRPSREPATEVA